MVLKRSEEDFECNRKEDGLLSESEVGLMAAKEWLSCRAVDERENGLSRRHVLAAVAQALLPYRG